MRVNWRRMSSLSVMNFLFSFYICVGLLVGIGRILAYTRDYNRDDFPFDFIFGAGSSAYQVEGAAVEDGRTASTADGYANGTFADNGDVSCDQYHKYKEDVQLMVDTGLDAYRLSISWSRLIPNGRGPINRKGLEYYNNLINELITHGIQPYVTLLHQDLPIALEDEYGGFSSPRIVEDFTSYANVCFREFGDRVQHWTTINEANLFALVLNIVWKEPTNSNITLETYDPYLPGYHVLLAHASAAKLYKNIYQAKQQGSIGISLYAYYFIPFSNSPEDRLATQRSYTFFIDWFMHPLIYGDYPRLMKRIVGSRLPIFTKVDSELLRGSFDFVGLNYYTSVMAKYDPLHLETKTVSEFDMDTIWIYSDGNNPRKEEPFANTPWALQGVLEHFKRVYNNPPIFIYENGQSTNCSTTSVDDPSRVEFLRDHIGSLIESLRNGSNVKGYFVWSFLDVFEFMYGYKRSFGLYYVNFSDHNLGRHPKISQKWYSTFLKKTNTIATQTIRSQEDDIPTVFSLESNESRRIK
ncbi:hypothetical protein vseg_003803 [Gypsophila vaccaria]